MSAYLSAIIQANPESFKEAMLIMDEDDRLGILARVNTFSEEAKEIISGLAKEQNGLFDDYTEWQRNFFAENPSQLFKNVRRQSVGAEIPKLPSTP